jgi:hypothetical protein
VGERDEDGGGEGASSAADEVVELDGSGHDLMPGCANGENGSSLGAWGVEGGSERVNEFLVISAGVNVLELSGHVKFYLLRNRFISYRLKSYNYR